MFTSASGNLGTCSVTAYYQCRDVFECSSTPLRLATAICRRNVEAVSNVSPSWHEADTNTSRKRLEAQSKASRSGVEEKDTFLEGFPKRSRR